MRMGVEDDEEGWMMGGGSRLQLERQKDTGSHRATTRRACNARHGKVPGRCTVVECELAHLKGWSEVA